MHTFPFFVGRQDESRFSEVCSARWFRPHQLPRSRKLQPQLVSAGPRALASAEPGWLRWGLRTARHALSLGTVPRSKGKPGKVLCSQAEGRTHITLDSGNMWGQTHWYKFLRGNPRKGELGAAFSPSHSLPSQHLTSANQSSGLAQFCLGHSFISSSMPFPAPSPSLPLPQQRPDTRSTCGCPEAELLQVPRGGRLCAGNWHAGWVLGEARGQNARLGKEGDRTGPRTKLRGKADL